MSRRGRLLLVALAMIGLLVGVAYFTNAPPNDPQEQERLQGTWHVVGIIAGGQGIPEPEVRQHALRYVFQGDTLTIHRPGRVPTTAPYSLVVTTTPRRITIEETPPIHGVYALEGDQLKLCLMMDGKARERFPRNLISTALPTTDLLTLIRK